MNFIHVIHLIRWNYLIALIDLTMAEISKSPTNPGQPWLATRARELAVLGPARPNRLASCPTAAPRGPDLIFRGR